MRVVNYDALLKEIVETFQFKYKDVHICDHVEFKEGFIVTRTYDPTVCISGRIFITYNEGEKALEIIDSDGNVNNWYDWIDLKNYNKMEIGIKINDYLASRNVERW